MKATVKASDLVRALVSVMPHAGDDTTLPAISCVQFEVIEQRLYLMATDRYTVGVSHMPLPEPKDQIKQPGVKSDLDFRTVLQIADVKQLFAVAKMASTAFKPLPTDVTIEVKGEQVHVTAGLESHVLRAAVGATAPPWRGLFPSTMDLTVDVGPYVAYNAQFMARFAKAGDKHDAMLTWRQPGTKPLLITVGDSFFGLIMPVKAEATVMLDHLPDWVRTGKWKLKESPSIAEAPVKAVAAKKAPAARRRPAA